MNEAAFVDLIFALMMVAAVMAWLRVEVRRRRLEQEQRQIELILAEMDRRFAALARKAEPGPFTDVVGLNGDGELVYKRKRHDEQV